jgi:hypothetical protein
MPFWHMLGNYSCGLLEIDHWDKTTTKNKHPVQEQTCSNCIQCNEIKINFTQIIINKLKFLIDSMPYYALQF